MGKSKKRILAKGIHQQISTLSRDEAIKYVVKNEPVEDITNIITLFGLKPEELLEAGMTYEQIKKLEGSF